VVYGESEIHRGQCAWRSHEAISTLLWLLLNPADLQISIFKEGERRF
jgi:hypothetical protein